MEDYILELVGDENDVLRELYRYSHLNVVYPEMISGHEQGRLLSMISKLVQPEKILEIGTFTGYSAICLAEGLSTDGHLHTIEINDEVTETALYFFEKTGNKEKITLHVGDALEIIPKLVLVFDLVFIDAAKKQYLDYYNAVLDKVKSGGVILVDNILWYGKVIDAKEQDETTIKLREFNDFLKNDNRVERAIITNRDGMFVLRKK